MQEGEKDERVGIFIVETHYRDGEKESFLFWEKIWLFLRKCILFSLFIFIRKQEYTLNE